MFEKNLSCELRVIFAVLSLVFLLTILFGKFFAIIGLLITAFVAATGVCLGAKILGPIVCKKSVIDAMDNLTDEVKEAADEAMDKAKDVADDVVDTVKDKVSKKD
ncbi:MAG: hypothetical protein V7749_03355 [Cocleimonas sp.]